jgi:microsomal dipeptidase-like Zn-dependent dipeptidase
MNGRTLRAAFPAAVVALVSLAATDARPSEAARETVPVTGAEAAAGTEVTGPASRVPGETAAPAACGSGPELAADIWQEYKEQTREAGCYIDWAPSSVERWGACMREYSKLPAQLGEELIGFWNSMAKNEWATIGPRRVEPGRNTGTLVAPGNRLWLTHTPEFMDEVTLTVTKRAKLSGKILNVGPEIAANTRVDVTVCRTDPEGNTDIIHEETVKAIADPGVVVEKTFDDPEPGVISINLQSQAAIPLTFKYALGFDVDPERFNAGPVDGFADIHVHQLADVGYGGMWYWGDHAAMDGELRPCRALDGPRRGQSWYRNTFRKAVASADFETSFDGELEFYTHAIPNVFPPDGHLNIQHGPPAPRSLDSWPRYDDIAHQQVSAAWLKEAHDAGLDLIVVSTVNFQAVCKVMRLLLAEEGPETYCNDPENVKAQLRAAQEMDRKYDWYEIAVHPWHARKIIHEGNLAVVLSMETSNMMPHGEGDFVAELEELRQMGLRTMQLAHETNSRFAGAATHKDFFNVFEALKHPLQGELGFDTDERGWNTRGLSKSGRRMVEALMDHHMPIDIAHLSAESVRDLYEVARSRDYYPLYDSHTRLRPVLPDVLLPDVPHGSDPKTTREAQGEFLTTCEQARMIEETGGIVGLRTGDTDLNTYVMEDDNGRRPVVANNCPGSARSFAQLVEFTAGETGLRMAFGSDLNGFITQAGPRFGPEACHRVQEPHRTAYAQEQRQGGETSESFRRVGLSHMGFLPDLLAELDHLGADVRRLEGSAEAFLRMWERAWSDDREPRHVETTCPWDASTVRHRVTEDGASPLPDPMFQVDDVLRVQVAGDPERSGSTETMVTGYSGGEAQAGSFVQQASLTAVSAVGGDHDVRGVRLRDAEWDEDGILSAADDRGPYELGTPISDPGRYVLEVHLMDARDRVLVGHTFFRVIPDPDSIRASVEYSIGGPTAVVSYDWDADEGQYEFTHSRGTEGHGTGQGWTFSTHVIPEVSSKDESTVQRFHLELDGEPVESGDRLFFAGEKTLAIYACHNVLAGPCDASQTPDRDAASGDREKEERQVPKKKRTPNEEKRMREAREESTAGALPPGMILIGRHTLSLDGQIDVPGADPLNPVRLDTSGLRYDGGG